MAEQKLTVGIADMKMLQGEGILPLNMEAGRTHPLKYADTGIKETLKAMEAKGASRSRMTVKIAGGAKMFEIAGGSGLGNIGQRNIESVHAIHPPAGGGRGRKGGQDPAL